MHVRKLKNPEDDKIVDMYVSSRLRARERESSDQRGSFIQSAQQAVVGGDIRACILR